MEYLDGESIERLIDSHNRRGFYVPLDDAMDILIQAVTGLAAIHQAGVVHRDIKPGNIMLTDNGLRSVIMDFGLVRKVEIDEEIRTMAGTPAYIAPEVAEGHPGSDRSPKADIYSMGVSAYELLTGALPFNGRTWVEIVRKHITEMPPFPSERRPGLPERIDDVVFRMLSKDPKERYPDCDELLEDLLIVERLVLPGSEVSSRVSYTPLGRRRYSTRAPSQTPGAAYRSTPAASGRGKLLVVDQDAAFRTKVHEVAKATVPGCRVYSATDGAMALKMMEEIIPNVLVVELSLPEVNGLELAATLRGDTVFDNTVIIVVSDTGGKKETEILDRLKVRCFLAKPVDEDTLADTLRPLLERPISIPRFSTPKPNPWF
jgi:CheY-like chemotaxis protein